MRLSRLVGRTLRQAPAEAHLPSHQLLVRAGYVRAPDGGEFAYLPLGVLAVQRLQALAARELARAGALPIALPSAAPEAVASVARREIDSYRQLPALLFDTGWAARAPGRPRAGLFGAAHRPVLDVYVLAGESTAVQAGQQVMSALEHIVAAGELPVTWAPACDTPFRLYVAHPDGDESRVHCPDCGYSAERSCVPLLWPAPPAEDELPPEEIETPGCNTIAALAEFLGLPAARTLKMVFYSVAGHVTCVVIRGDRAVDEARLARLLGTDRYSASLEDELAAAGAVGGYASPIGLDPGRVRVVADPSVRSGRNWVTGANRPGYHLRHVNIPRDFEPDEWAELALVEPGDPCPCCGGRLAVECAFALAHSRPPLPAAGEFLDEAGRPRPILAHSWQLDLGRLLAAIAERHHDGYGLAWPTACAPLDAHLVGIDLRQEEVAAQAEALYARLQADGLAVLYDDRDASPGVKFADADLIGLPLRLTISKRSLQDGSVEAKWRTSPDRLKLDGAALAAELARLRAARAQ